MAIVAEVPADGNGQWGERIFDGDPGAGRHYQVAKAEKPGIVLPGGDITVRVESNDEEAFSGRVLPLQNLQRVNGEALAAAADLQVRGLERRVITDCSFDHGKPVEKRDLAGNLLVRRVGSGNKEDPVELERLLCLFGNAQVRQVDRIECAAQNAGFHSKQ